MTTMPKQTPKPAVPLIKEAETEIVQELKKPYTVPLWVYLAISVATLGIAALLLHG